MRLGQLEALSRRTTFRRVRFARARGVPYNLRIQRRMIWRPAVRGGRALALPEHKQETEKLFDALEQSK